MAEPFATPESNQGMRQLIGLALRVLLIPGVQIGKNPFTAEVAEGDHHHKSADQDRHDQEEHAAVDAAQEQDAHRDCRDHQKGAHIRLGQQKHADDGQRHRHRPDRLEEVLTRVHLSHHVAGRIHRDRHLGQLGRLKVHHPQRQPTARAVNHLADAWNQHRHQQDQRQHKHPRRQALPGRDRDLHRDQGGGQAKHQRKDMARQKMRGQIFGETRVVGHRNRGRIDHQQPQAHQGQGDPDEGQVEALDARRLAGRR